MGLRSGPPISSESSRVTTQHSTMAELGLKKKEVDAIEFAFDVYDFKGDGNADAFYAGDLIRACNLNPTLKTINEIGGQSEKGKKMLSKADVFPMYKACKDSKDQGGFHDFVEILKLYDKNDDNTMIAHELFMISTKSWKPPWSLESLQALYMGNTSAFFSCFFPFSDSPPTSAMVLRVGLRLQARMRSPA